MERGKVIQHTEDWWALWIGLFVFCLSLGALVGKDLLGWGVATSVWLDLTKALGPVSKVYAGLPGIVALVLTYLFMLVIVGAGAKALRFNLKEFAVGFTVIFWVSFGCWLIGNFFPGVAAFLKEATRPEWYIKIAIVILGASLGVQAAGATGAAIRERPVVPVMVSSLVVFAVVELLFLPFLAQTFPYHQPLVAGAWMGLAVKTDGAAVASGAITDALIRAKALAVTGVAYKEGWMLLTTTTVKVFIDVFIGIWAFVLALIWVYVIEKKPGVKVSAVKIWERFPKFVIGYFITFLAMLLVAFRAPDLLGAARVTMAESNVFRVLFFAMTFFTIGLVSNFKKLWEEGIGKLALVLAGLVWVSYTFFTG